MSKHDSRPDQPPSPERAEHKRIVLDRARNILATSGSQESWEAFMSFLNAEDERDPKLYELIDLIEHIPSRKGLFRARSKEYDAHIQRIRELIGAAEG